MAQPTAPEQPNVPDGVTSIAVTETEMKPPASVDQPVAPGVNLFEFTLPVTKKIVNFKFMTGGDERRRSLAEERRKKMFPGASDADVTSILDTLIVSIGGITDRNKIKSFISNMPGILDMKA